MRSRQQFLGNSSSNNHNNHHTNSRSSGVGDGHSMNPNSNIDMSHNNARRGSSNGGGGDNSSSSMGGGSGMSTSGLIRQRRFSHHSPGAGCGGGGDGSAGIGGSGHQPGAAAVAMNDYQFPLSHSGLGGAAFGSFGHAPNAMAATAAGMNTAAMNTAAMNMNNMNMNMNMYATAGMPHHPHHHQSQQQPSFGDHLGVAAATGDYRAAAVVSGGSGMAGAVTNQAAGSMPGSSSMSQQEREEELLLNLLIARRQRAAMRGDQQQMGAPGSGGGGGGNSSTSWADDWMRIRNQSNNAALLSQQQQEHLAGMGGSSGAGGVGENGPYDGLPNMLGEGSMRSHSGMSGIGQLPNNVNNMAGAGGGNQHPSQFLPDSSRLLHRGGSLQMGSPQGPWMGGGGNPAGAAMQTHRHTSSRNDISYAQGPNMNTQLGLDILERADRAMPGNMMHDARSAEQGSMVGPSHQYAEAAQPAKKKRQHKKKPADMPRRPLSAYNLFFSDERERILREIEGKSREEDDDDETTEGKAFEGQEPDKKDEEEDGKPKALLRPLLPSEKKRRPHRKSHGKISFQLLAQRVGQRWKALPDDRRKYYQDLAQEDMKRQKKAMEEYYQKRSELTESENKE